MDITPGSYPDFTSETSLEELVLNMARKFLELQKNAVLNNTGFDYINLTTDEEAATATMSLEGLPASIEAGTIIIAQPSFTTQPTFNVAVDAVYPWNRTHLIDALFHLIMWQSRLEVQRSTNDDENEIFIEWSISNASYGASSPCVAEASLTNIPLIIELYSPSRAKPYLANL